MVEILVTDEFETWYLELNPQDDPAVMRVIGLLEEKGVALGFPYSSDIRESRVALRELRIQSSGHPVHLFYKFDPIRRAVLLIGGGKTGDARFYEKMLPLAERLWAEYLKSIEKELEA